MRLLVDENLRSRELISRLASAGHELLDVPLGTADQAIWNEAQAAGAAVVTLNGKDFVPFALATSKHSGLLLVFRTNDRATDMRASDIALAIDRVERDEAGGVADRVIILNSYRGPERT